MEFPGTHPLAGYRRLTFLLLSRGDRGRQPGCGRPRAQAVNGYLMDRWNGKTSKKGTGFVQPLQPHDHWHIDISYLNLAGTFYYMCSILDGCSRAIVHGEIREAMKEVDVEIIRQRAREKYPGAHPRIITDNGPQFIARDFKEFIRIAGMTPVKTSPYPPQSNGKSERSHRTINGECLRFHWPLSLDEARRLVEEYVRHYNEVRLHSGIGYVTPLTQLEGRDQQVFAERDRKREEALERRKANRPAAAANQAIA